MPARLPNDVAACNLIRSHHNHNRNVRRRAYQKTITTLLSKEDNRQLSVRLQINYDPKNDSVATTICLRYYTQTIMPGTHRKLLCTNAAALDKLNQKRTLDKRRAYARKRGRVA